MDVKHRISTTMICNKLLSFKNEKQALLELLAKKGRQCRFKIFNSYFFWGGGWYGLFKTAWGNYSWTWKQFSYSSMGLALLYIQVGLIFTNIFVDWWPLWLILIPWCWHNCWCWSWRGQSRDGTGAESDGYINNQLTAAVTVSFIALFKDSNG